jgi:hypothetical protein
MTTKFLIFLQTECVAIAAFLDEVGGHELSQEEEEEVVNMKMIDEVVSRYQGLKNYFDSEDIDFETTPNTIANLDLSELQPWAKSIRVMVIDHLITMDINIPLLIEIVETYRFEADIEEVVEMVRSFDILGAAKRLSEYEALLYMKLKDTLKSKELWEEICGERLPVSFFEHVEKFKFRDGLFLDVVGLIGSQRLIEYFSKNYPQVDNHRMFIMLCENGHLSVAQWLQNLHSVDIHAQHEQAFRKFCKNGQLTIAQSLYDFGGVNIHANDDEAFRWASKAGHLHVVQWLYGLGGVNIHSRNNEAFRMTCHNGHLAVAQWLYGFGEVNIHYNYDEAFDSACRKGHLSLAQWLYNLGGVSTHGMGDYLFLATCNNGHLLVAQWLYSLSGINIIPILTRENAFRGACLEGHLEVAQWLYSLGDVDIHGESDYAFRNAYFYGNKSIVQWLFSLGGIPADLLEGNPNIRSWVESVAVQDQDLNGI